MKVSFCITVWCFCVVILCFRTTNSAKFPDNFKWGFATSSYQIEGAWSLDGKGESIWDTFTHREESPIADGATGDVAADSYNKFAVDVQLLKETGADFYRFSLSWSRILPNGTIDVINQPGIDYYNRLIDELLANGIEPVVTTYHWDLPEALQALGGWPSEELVPHYAEYARLVFASFGDRVKTWITFNEPAVFCTNGYETGIHAPGIRRPAEQPYLCAHTVLKSHARAYRIYEEEFKATQQGRVGITLDTSWFEPKTDDPEDIVAAERARQFRHGWFASPLFFGKYPDVMREYIDEETTSRLPEFDENWILQIQGSFDFLGLNHYSTFVVRNFPIAGALRLKGWTLDQETLPHFDPDWEESASSWLKVVPWGFRSLLNWIKTTYGNPEIYVTENGFSTVPEVGLNDTRRVNYYKEYIENMHAAIVEDGCNITRYTAWSLVDNFEWAAGYTQRFGVYEVDFNDPARPRTAKESAKFLTQVFTNNEIPDATVSKSSSKTNM